MPEPLDTALRKLNRRDFDFVRTYATFQREHPGARDIDLAMHLGCTRRTIVNRRKRLRAAGVKLPRFATPGGVKGRERPQRPCCPSCGRMHPMPRKRCQTHGEALQRLGVTVGDGAATMG